MNANLKDPNKWWGRNVSKDMNAHSRDSHREWSDTWFNTVETYEIYRTLQMRQLFINRVTITWILRVSVFGRQSLGNSNPRLPFEVIENKTYILAEHIISLFIRLMHCIFFIVNEKHVITAVAKLTRGSYG